MLFENYFHIEPTWRDMHRIRENLRAIYDTGVVPQLEAVSPSRAFSEVRMLNKAAMPYRNFQLANKSANEWWRYHADAHRIWDTDPKGPWFPLLKTMVLNGAKANLAAEQVGYSGIRLKVYEEDIACC